MELHVSYLNFMDKKKILTINNSYKGCTQYLNSHKDTK